MNRPRTLAYHSGPSILAIAAALVVCASAALAEPDGPDAWAVAGVAVDDVLNMRAAPRANARIVAGIPYDATGLANLGCAGTPDFARWQRMSQAERERAALRRWCKVRFGNLEGWVAGRFLRESP